MIRRRRRALAALFVLASSGRRTEAAEAPAGPREGAWAVRGSKDFGLHSPRGRAIYLPNETFEATVDSRRRTFVLEAAAGLGPEGNLGLAVGWLPKALHGVEFYAGAGVEANPAFHVSGAVRFLFNIKGYRPYVGLGYFYKDAFVIDTYAHNAFIEGGYSWKVGATNHLTLGVGVARLVAVGVRRDSVLRTSEVDARGLEEQLDAVPRLLPILTLRYSRAF